MQEAKNWMKSVLFCSTRQLRSQQTRQTDAQPSSQASTAPSNGESNDSRQREDDQNNPLQSLMQSILNSVRFGNPSGGPQNEQQSASPTAAPNCSGRYCLRGKWEPSIYFCQACIWTILGISESVAFNFPFNGKSTLINMHYIKSFNTTWRPIVKNNIVISGRFWYRSWTAHNRPVVAIFAGRIGHRYTFWPDCVNNTQLDNFVRINCGKFRNVAYVFML